MSDNDRTLFGGAPPDSEAPSNGNGRKRRLRETWDEILTPAQVADLLGINESSVYKLAKRGELPALDTGGKRIIRFYRPTVEAHKKRKAEEAKLREAKRRLTEDRRQMRTILEPLLDDSPWTPKAPEIIGTAEGIADLAHAIKNLMKSIFALGDRLAAVEGTLEKAETALEAFHRDMTTSAPKD